MNQDMHLLHPTPHCSQTPTGHPTGAPPPPAAWRAPAGLSQVLLPGTALPDTGGDARGEGVRRGQAEWTPRNRQDTAG